MKKTTVILTLFCALLLTGCAGTNDSAAGRSSLFETLAEAETQAEAETAPEAAQEVETVAPEPVGFAGMEPVYADALRDGEYEITVDSSSSMFQITSCTLHVENGAMTAVMTMGGTGYLHLYMGTPEEAMQAAEADLIGYEEPEEGVHTFTVPVEALNKETDCAAYSKRKETWYGRVLVFRADTLPLDAYREGSVATAGSLGLEDGRYTVGVTLEGGSGKAYVESPAVLTVEDGQARATITWSSANYDYMIVDEEKYLPENTDGNSVFTIPVTAFDFASPVRADTTAMSTPHEIEYTLYFDSTTLEKTE